MKYRFIDSQRGSHGVRSLCAALDVSPSGYYAARHRPPSAGSLRRSGLTAQIRAIHDASRQTYGSPRVHVELLAQGVPCCQNTVAKLMQQAKIAPKAIRRFRVTTDSRNTTASPNLLPRAFEADGPNESWLSDITYIPTREGWLYLAAILDLHSRAIVGWAMSKTLDSQLATDALVMAIAKRGVAPLMESFFHTLKTELVMHCDYKTRAQARSSLFDYMEVFYNRQRRHSSINYEAPPSFEHQQPPN